MAGRRTSSDKEWQKVKKEVKDRDNGEDRILRVISYRDALILKKKAGSFLKIIDPAHVIAVSEAPELTYYKANIISLNRYSHSNLDEFKDPIDGHNITKQEVEEWWIRLLKANPSQYKEFVSILAEHGYNTDRYK